MSLPSRNPKEFLDWSDIKYLIKDAYIDGAGPELIVEALSSSQDFQEFKGKVVALIDGAWAAGASQRDVRE